MTTSKREQAAKDHPDVWIAVEVGDTLAGTVTDVDTAWSDAKNQGTGDGWYPLLTVKKDDGRIVRWHAFETVALSQVLKMQPLPGERIVVIFDGEGKAKEGKNAPKLFKVTCPDRDPTVAARGAYAKLGAAPAPSADLPADTGDIPF